MHFLTYSLNEQLRSAKTKMKTIIRLVKFEFQLVRVLFFRVIFERFANTIVAAVAGFGAVFYTSFASHGVFAITPSPENFSQLQGALLFSFLYAETIMANWQYTTNKSGRMELIFNSTQPPLRIIFAKCFASATITLVSLVALYLLPLAWFGLLGTFNFAFWITAGATLFVCSAVMSFNAIFEFQVKQVKAITAMLNLVLPYLAIRNAAHLPAIYGFIPYFSGAKFLSLNDHFIASDVALLYLFSATTGLFFLTLAQLVVRRIRNTASVYLE